MLLTQSAGYLATGVWPILDRHSFELVTGPKTDFWLVRTVGVLVAVIGFVLGIGGMRRPRSLQAIALASASAIGLSAVDLNYALRGRISRVYLLDALVELTGALLLLRSLRAGGTPTA